MCEATGWMCFVESVRVCVSCVHVCVRFTGGLCARVCQRVHEPCARVDVSHEHRVSALGVPHHAVLAAHVAHSRTSHSRTRIPKRMVSSERWLNFNNTGILR